MYCPQGIAKQEGKRFDPAQKRIIFIYQKQQIQAQENPGKNKDSKIPNSIHQGDGFELFTPIITLSGLVFKREKLSVKVCKYLILKNTHYQDYNEAGHSDVYSAESLSCPEYQGPDATLISRGFCHNNVRPGYGCQYTYVIRKPR